MNRSVSRYAAAIGLLLLPAIAIADMLTASVSRERVYRLGVGTGGEIAAIHHAAGDSVMRGDLLLELDNRHYRAAVAAAESARAYAMAVHEEAVRSHDRDSVLYDEGSLSAVELDLAKIRSLDAQSALARADSDLAQARYRLLAGSIRAPESGIVLGLAARAGERVYPEGYPAIQMILGAGDKVLELPLHALGQLFSGSGDIIRVTAFPDPAFNARIVRVGTDPIRRVARLYLEAPDRLPEYGSVLIGRE